MILNFKSLPTLIYLILLSLTGLIPEYGSLDRVAPQWLYLSSINLLGLIHVFSLKDSNNDLKEIVVFKPFIVLMGFILWGLLSYFYAINSIEVLVKFIRWINIPASILITSILIKKVDFNPIIFIGYIFLGILLIELYFSYSTYFQITSLTEYNFSFANIIKGSSANKNITAASILMKLPLIFFLISKSKNIFLRLFFSITVFSTIYLVFLLSARASIISVFLVTISLILIYIIKSVSQKKWTFDSSFALIITPFFLSTLLFQLQYGNDNSASLNRRATTINTKDPSTGQRIRFYKHSLTQILSNPLIGTGMGNWKIKSIDYDKNDVEGYVVPYHTHNDFLEVGAELGLPGLILYLLIFIFSFLILIKRIFFSLKNEDFLSISFILFLGGIVYFVDANLNFPHARPLMQIPFIIYLSLLYQISNKKLSDANF